jgi:hypothetical protein
LRNKREDWGEGSKNIEKQKFQFMGYIAHPNPPPLRALHAGMFISARKRRTGL